MKLKQVKLLIVDTKIAPECETLIAQARDIREIRTILRTRELVYQAHKDDHVCTAVAVVSQLYNLTLTAVGLNKIGVIKAIRELTTLGLKEAKDVADMCQPGNAQHILSEVSREVALKGQQVLNAAGATCLVVSS